MMMDKIVENNIKFLRDDFKERYVSLQNLQLTTSLLIGSFVAYLVFYTTITLVTGILLISILMMLIFLFLVLYHHLETEKETIEEFKILYGMYKSTHHLGKNARTKRKRKPGRPRKKSTPR